MKRHMLVSLLAAAMAAEFDNCARPAGEWVGFDQVTTLYQSAHPPMRSRSLTTPVLPCRASAIPLGGRLRRLATTSISPEKGTLRPPPLPWIG